MIKIRNFTTRKIYHTYAFNQYQMKPLLKIATVALMCVSSVANASPRHGYVGGTNTNVILHAWSWSFNTIAENMQAIANAGYDFVQTSPANQCFVGEGGGKALFSKPGDAVTGKWYYYYQPTDWKIGNYLLGTRDEFKAMCDSAMKYNVRVLVDVLPNHTAIDHKSVSADLDNAVGGHENLFHANGFTPITKWNDRYECTTGEMGGLPDVNTENPDFQYYYMQYVNDLINLGARGFRYDTAKHIGLPSDPTDAKVERNNFWPVATGREAAKGLSLLMPDSLYIYGEVLQDKNVKEREYTEFIDVTASNYGHALRNVLEKGDFRADDLVSWHHKARPDSLVTWVESHDTYCNQNESASLEDNQIRMGWVFLTARSGGTPLFFSRPDGSTRQNFWGKNLVGPRGNDEFMHPEVVAVNKFRHAMAGEQEQIYATENGAVAEVCRGNAGVAVVNFSAKEQKLSVATTLADGTYTDALHGTEFKVKNGVMKARVAPLTSYIIYK